MKNPIKNIFYILAIFFITVLSINPAEAAITPNDPEVNKQEYLGQISAFAAWEKTTGSNEVVIAVIDSGVYLDHPDLKDNIWVNADEIPNDGIDNDNNGYIDDYHGWDFLTETPDPNPKIESGYNVAGISHGTFVAGIIAASGNNNLGISGISWRSKIMPLRVLDSQGNGESENIIKAINYAVNNGADIINFSIVTFDYSQDLTDAISNAYQEGKILVAAAGNETLIFAGQDAGYDLDFFPFYPVCLNGDNNDILGVASVDKNDVKSLFSNYGQTCVDLSAPGEEFFGLNYYNPLIPEFRNYYLDGWSGTSLATPVVSGGAALVKSLRPELAASQIYDLLINSGDDINNKNPTHLNQLGKRINLKNLINQAEESLNISNRKIVVSPTINNLPIVAVYDLDGTKENEFYAYNIKFKGGVNLAVGNVKSDWSEEIVTAAGKTGGPHIRVFNKQGNIISQFFAYEPNFTGGVKVAIIKYQNESERKIITAPQSNFKPQIKIFDYHGNLLKEFLTFEENYLGGLNLAVADVNGDGFEEILVTKAVAGSQVRIFNQEGNLLSQFEAFDITIQGLNLAAADIDNDGQAEIIVAPTNNSEGKVKIFDDLGNLKKQFTAFETTYNGGVNLSASDVDLDGQTEILATPNNNYPPKVKIYSPEGNLKFNIPVFSSEFNQGLEISTSN